MIIKNLANVSQNEKMNILITTYLILAFGYKLSDIRAGSNGFKAANRTFIALVSSFLLVNVLALIFTHWYSGTLPEFIAFQMRQVELLNSLELSLIFVVVTVPILNFWEKPRSNKRLQIGITTVALIQTVTSYINSGYEMSFSLSSFDSVRIAGWHTQIVEPLRLFEAGLILFGSFILTFILSRVRTNNSK